MLWWQRRIVMAIGLICSAATTWHKCYWCNIWSLWYYRQPGHLLSFATPENNLLRIKKLQFRINWSSGVRFGTFRLAGEGVLYIVVGWLTLNSGPSWELVPALGNDRLTANNRICFILSIILRAGDHDFEKSNQAPAIIILLLPLRVSFCQFNTEVEQNWKHNVSRWGEHNVSMSSK